MTQHWPNYTPLENDNLLVVYILSFDVQKRIFFNIIMIMVLNTTSSMTAMTYTLCHSSVAGWQHAMLQTPGIGFNIGSPVLGQVSINVHLMIPGSLSRI